MEDPLHHLNKSAFRSLERAEIDATARERTEVYHSSLRFVQASSNSVLRELTLRTDDRFYFDGEQTPSGCALTNAAVFE
jgi:hypothetical protein